MALAQPAPGRDWSLLALIAAISVSAAGAVATALAVALPAFVWHPLRTGGCTATDHSGCGYQFWSGIGSDLGELTIVASIASITLMFYRRFNCHADGCWRLSWHNHDDHGHPVCRVHHPDGDDRPHTIRGVAHHLVASLTKGVS